MELIKNRWIAFIPPGTRVSPVWSKLLEGTVVGPYGHLVGLSWVRFDGLSDDFGVWNDELVILSPAQSESDNVPLFDEP